MKIQNIHNMDVGLRGLAELGAHGPETDSSVQFRKTLSALSRDQLESRLGGLISDIDAQAKKITSRADLKEFEKYRSLIRDFMNEVVSNGFEFNKEDNYASRGRHRVFATINKVNEKLEALAKDMLSNQSDNIEIVNKIDDIRGLLLDLML